MWLRRFSSGFSQPKATITKYLPALGAVGTGVVFVGILNRFSDPNDLKDPFSTSPEEDGALLNEAQKAAPKHAKIASVDAALKATPESGAIADTSPRMGSGKWHEVTKAPIAAPAPSYPTWAAHLLSGGWRVDTASIAANNPMEDRTVVEAFGDGILCGVFDGHYGPRLSEFGRTNARDMFRKALEEETKSGNRDVTSSMRRYFHYMEDGWTRLAQNLINGGDWTPAMEGACAVMAYVTPERVVIGNVGDSRAILVRQEHTGGELTVVQLTTEHNIRDPAERAKLQAAHPEDPNAATYVRDARAWYVCGLLQVTRSLGDLFLKKAEFFKLLPAQLTPSSLSLETFRPPYISSDPEVLSRPLDDKDLFLVIATDGLWDELKNPEVAKLLVSRKASEPARAAPPPPPPAGTAPAPGDTPPKKPSITDMVRELEGRVHLRGGVSGLQPDVLLASKDPASFLQHVRFPAAAAAAAAAAGPAAHLTLEGAMRDCNGPACAESLPADALTNAGQRLLWGALLRNRVAERNGVEQGMRSDLPGHVEQVLEIPQGRGRRSIHDDISIVVVLLRPGAAAAAAAAPTARG